MPGRLAIAALTAVLVVLLTIVGALDHVPTWARALCQAAGTIAGIYLGVRLQDLDQKTSIEGTARAALSNLAALAGGLKSLMAYSASVRGRMANEPPTTVAAFAQATDTCLEGLDSQARALLGQTKAAAAAWVPFVEDPEEYLSELEGGA